MTHTAGKPVNQTALMLESGLRALMYCLHPRVIYLSLLPLLLAGVTLACLSYWGWEAGEAGVRNLLESWDLTQTMFSWMDRVGLSMFHLAMARVLLLLLVVPLVIVACLLLVGAFLTPAIVALIRRGRFASLQSTYSTPWWRSLLWSLGATVVALVAFVLSLPLWWIPFLAIVLPPLTWGWLTYRVMAYDTLADLATPAERDALLKGHRRTLLVMGVVCGYLGAAPTALWALGAVTIFLAPFLIIASVWIYTLVFAFSSLWFANYLLPVLQARREGRGDLPLVEEVA